MGKRKGTPSEKNTRVHAEPTAEKDCFIEWQGRRRVGLMIEEFPAEQATGFIGNPPLVHPVEWGQLLDICRNGWPDDGDDSSFEHFNQAELAKWIDSHPNMHLQHQTSMRGSHTWEITCQHSNLLLATTTTSCNPFQTRLVIQIDESDFQTGLPVDANGVTVSVCIRLYFPRDRPWDNACLSPTGLTPSTVMISFEDQNRPVTKKGNHTHTQRSCKKEEEGEEEKKKCLTLFALLGAEQ